MPCPRLAQLTLALTSLAGCAAPRAFGPTDRAAVLQVLGDQRAAWNRGDLEGFMSGYKRSPELVFTSGGSIRRGWQDAHDHYLTRYGGDRAGMGQLTFEILSIQPLGADGAIVLGRWHLGATPQAGGGVFSVALERTPAGWRIVHDHTSSDPLPAPMPTP